MTLQDILETWVDFHDNPDYLSLYDYERHLVEWEEILEIIYQERASPTPHMPLGCLPEISRWFVTPAGSIGTLDDTAFWVTGRLGAVPIHKMDATHLRNTVNMLRRAARSGWGQGFKLPYLEAELERRKSNERTNHRR